jgi:hypothetical protein
MIFKHTAHWITGWSPHTGQPKTQTRRPARLDDRYAYVSDRDDRRLSIYRNGRLLYQTGRAYAIQPGRGMKGIGRFRLVSLDFVGQAKDISEADARAEGFASPDNFRAVWCTMYGDKGLDQPCYSLVISKEPSK